MKERGKYDIARQLLNEAIDQWYKDLDEKLFKLAKSLFKVKIKRRIIKNE